MEIEELVARCKDGDDAAIVTLYRLNIPRLKKICRRIVHNEQAAEDIVHDAFIIIITSLDSLKDSSRITAWMNRITINLSYEYMKSQNRQTLSLNDINDDTFPDTENTPIDLLSFETLIRMINNLPESYRNIFKLSVLEGLSHKEISALLHIKPHTSSSILFVAKSKLKKMIAEYQRLILLLFTVVIPVWYLLTYELSQSEEMGKESVIKRKSETVPIKHESKESGISQSLTRQSNSLSKQSFLFRPTFANHPTTTDSINYTATIDTTRLIEDSILNITHPSITPKENYTQQFHTPYTTSCTRKSDEWYLSVRYESGRKTANSLPTLPQTYAISPQDATSDATLPVESFKRWEHYADYIAQLSTTSNDAKVPFLLAIARHNHGEIRQYKHFDIPLTFEIMVDKALDRHWNAGAGIGYTKTKTDVLTGENGYFTKEQQQIRYIGIPVKGIYHIDFGRHWSVYLSGGVKLYIPIYAHNEIRYVVDWNLAYKELMHISAPLQWSVSTGLGLQYNFTPTIGIFIEPNLNYNFCNGSGIYTPFNVQRTNLTIPFGIRIKY